MLPAPTVLDDLKNASRENKRGQSQHALKTFKRAEKCNGMAQWLPSWLERSTTSPAVMETGVSALQIRTGWLLWAGRVTATLYAVPVARGAAP